MRVTASLHLISQNSVGREDWEKIAAPHAGGNEMGICEHIVLPLPPPPPFLLCLESPNVHRTFPLLQCTLIMILDLVELHDKPEMTWIN